MEVDQQRRTPAIAQTLKFACKSFVIWPVNLCDATLEFAPSNPVPPDFAQPLQTPRHKTQPAA